VAWLVVLATASNTYGRVSCALCVEMRIDDLYHDCAKIQRVIWNLLNSGFNTTDTTVEPAEKSQTGFLGWGFQRRCRDHSELIDWAEEYKVLKCMDSWLTLEIIVVGYEKSGALILS